METSILTSTEVVVVDNPAALAVTTARRIVTLAGQAIQSQGEFSIALAGGTTPRSVYELLARPPYKQSLEWPLIKFYFGDERCVPPEHHDSNYAMVNQALFSNLEPGLEQIYRIPAEGTDLDRIAQEYEALLPQSFDLVLLGIGSDGHTASIFPGSKAATDKIKSVTVVTNAPTPPSCRLTITPRVIQNAKSIIMLAAGKNKAKIVAAALKGSFAPEQLPAQLALLGTWIIDRDAAADLMASTK